MESDELIPVVVAGATGRMGRETVQAVLGQVDMRLAAAVGHARNVGEDIGELVTGDRCGVPVTTDLDAAMAEARGGVLVDFSTGGAVKERVLKAMAHNLACVIGTTGIPAADEDEIEDAARTRRHPVLIAPNFALGAVLMMKFAREAARYYRWAEIIELHHERKLDAPSGTARRTAELMTRARPDGFRMPAEGEETVKGARGGNMGGIRIHSVRLPGLLAHQMVLLGGTGETLTLKHDAATRECFMPGVILAVQRVRKLTGFAVGLENLLD